MWDLKRPPVWIYEEAEGKRARRATPGRERKGEVIGLVDEKAILSESKDENVEDKITA